MKEFIGKLHFNEKGYIPAIIQDTASKKVLTLCYMTKKALEKTLETGKVYVFRRSLNKLMMKGETSGNIQIVKDVYADCENNSLLFMVDQKVAACHAGYFTCYFQKLDKSGQLIISEKKIFEPDKIYTAAKKPLKKG